MNILLVAEEAAGVQALRLLSGSDHLLSGVLTTIDSPNTAAHKEKYGGTADTGKKSSNSSITAVAGRMDVPVMAAECVRNPDFARWMKSHHIDVLLNVHSLYQICPEVVQAAEFGAFNLHPGPLPAYAGLNVPSWAVYNEEATHAVTVHYISGKIDAGHIVYETQFPLTSADTGLSVSTTCSQKGMALIKRLLDQLSSDPAAVPSRPQDLSQQKVYKSRQVPGKGFIQWTEPAHRVNAFVRACNYVPFLSPWGEPKTRWGEKEISILKTSLSPDICHEIPGTIGQMMDGKRAVATADYWILVGKCKVDGATSVAASFLKQGDILTSGV